MLLKKASNFGRNIYLIHLVNEQLTNIIKFAYEFLKIIIRYIITYFKSFLLGNIYNMFDFTRKISTY